MRGNDRSVGKPDAVPECLVRSMGQVHHHPEGVHLGQGFLPERTQPMPAFPFCSAVCQRIVTIMRQGHIPNAHPEKQTQQRQGFLDRRAVLHAQEYRDKTVFAVLRYLLRRACKRNHVRILVDAVIDGRKHFQSIPGGRIRSHLRRCIEGKKGAADSPAPELGKIDVPIPVVDARIPKPYQLGRRIDMTVKNFHYLVP